MLLHMSAEMIHCLDTTKRVWYAIISTEYCIFKNQNSVKKRGNKLLSAIGKINSLFPNTTYYYLIMSKRKCLDHKRACIN